MEGGLIDFVSKARIIIVRKKKTRLNNLVKKLTLFQEDLLKKKAE